MIATCHKCDRFAVLPGGIGACLVGNCRMMDCVEQGVCPHPDGPRFGSAGVPRGVSLLVVSAESRPAGACSNCGGAHSSASCPIPAGYDGNYRNDSKGTGPCNC